MESVSDTHRVRFVEDRMPEEQRKIENSHLIGVARKANILAKVALELRGQTELQEREKESFWASIMELRSRIRAVIQQTLAPKDISEEQLLAPVHDMGEGIYIGSDEYVWDLLCSMNFNGYPKGFFPKLIVSLSSVITGREESYQKAFREWEITHMNIPLRGTQESFEQLIRKFPSLVKRFYLALIQKRQILIHCSEGKEYAPVVLAMIFVKLLEVPFDVAYRYIQHCCPLVEPLKEEKERSEFNFAEAAKHWVEGSCQ